MKRQHPLAFPSRSPMWETITKPVTGCWRISGNVTPISAVERKLRFVQIEP